MHFERCRETFALWGAKRRRAVPLLCLIGLGTLPACGTELATERRQILDRDPRNDLVEFFLEASEGTLDYCVVDVSAEATPMDVLRVLLHAAELLVERDVQQVRLCFRGEPRFVLDGDDFRMMGREYGTQNPTYTVRTFAEKLRLPSGEKAYEDHEGGLLFLLRVQMADFNDVNEVWYLNDLRAEREAELDARRPRVFEPEEEIF